jgi:hypothetical protein
VISRGYFRAQATAFLNQPDGNDRSGKKKPKKAPAQAWGLLAVPLGNAANRRRFNDWFRWDRDGSVASPVARLTMIAAIRSRSSVVLPVPGVRTVAAVVISSE